MACLGYFEHKDITEDRKVCKILSGLQDNHVQDWISINHLNLTFAEFMEEFCSANLPENWEEITRIKLLSMSQSDLSFWDFAINVQTKKSLLHNTLSYLAKEALCHCIESGMSQKLALCCRLEKTGKAAKFEDWLMEIKHLMHMERVGFEALAKSTCEASRQSNALSEPYRHGNMAKNTTSLLNT